MIVVTTITNAGGGGGAGAEGGAGSSRGFGYVGDQRGEQRRGDDDEAGEADRAVDVGGRRRRAVAQGAPAFGPALVDVGAAKPDPESARERGFAAPGVRAGMRATVAAERAQGAAPAPTGRGRQGRREQGGHPGGYHVCHIIEAGGGPA